MKIAVVGAGAMGCLWSARLASSSAAVTLVDVDPTIVDAINHEGITVESRSGPPLRSRVTATRNAADVGLADMIFFFVKAHHTRSAAGTAQSLVGPATIVVSLQNGWGNADVLAEAYPPDQIVVGVTYNSATVMRPGHVAHTGSGPTFVGPYVDHQDLQQATAVANCLTPAGFVTQPTLEVKTEVWKKLILNAATLPTAALTRLRAGELAQPEGMGELLDGLAAEAVDVARAQGYAIDRAERLERIHATLAGAGAGKPSMLQDIEANRKTEIEVVTGAVVKAATSLGIDVPLNRVMLALIGGLERAQARQP